MRHFAEPQASSNVTPDAARYNRPNPAPCKAILPRKFDGIFVGNVGGSDCQHIGFAQLRLEMSRSARTSSTTLTPTLGVHISGVIEGRTGEEMHRVAANRVVASVADKEASSIAATGETVSQAVGVITNALERQPSISFSFAGARPLPTLVGATPLNAGPEGTRKRAISLNVPFPSVRNTAIRAPVNNHVPLISDCFGRVKYAA